jgi:guanine deaminase
MLDQEGENRPQACRYRLAQIHSGKPLARSAPRTALSFPYAEPKAIRSKVHHTMNKNALMRRALQLARERARAGHGGPFGAVIVKDGDIIAEGWNQVTLMNDPTAHAEMVAIRKACADLGRFHLFGCEIYTSCEPCPMCLGGIYWARLDRIYYANTRVEAAAIGFDDGLIYRELELPPEQRQIPAFRLLPEEGQAAFSEWEANPDKVRY